SFGSWGVSTCESASGSLSDKSPALRRSLLRRVPNLGEELEQFGFGFLQLGAIEGEEIVDTEEGLGHLGEELHLVGQGIVFHAFAVVKQGRVAVAALLVFFVGGFDARLFKIQLLIVIGVSQF